MARKLTLAAVVRLITSAVKPTAAKLPKGGLAHGTVNGRRTLYGSDGTTVYELTPVASASALGAVKVGSSTYGATYQTAYLGVQTIAPRLDNSGVLQTDVPLALYPSVGSSAAKLQQGMMTKAMTRLMPVAIVVVRFTAAKTCELNQVRDVLGSSMSAYSFDSATYPYIRINVPAALSALGLSWTAEASEIRFSGTLDRTFPAPMADWDGTHLQGLFVQGPSDVDLTGYGIVFKVYAS